MCRCSKKNAFQGFKEEKSAKKGEKELFYVNNVRPFIKNTLKMKPTTQEQRQGKQKGGGRKT